LATGSSPDKYTMKNILTTLLTVFVSALSSGKGLENIIVEKYYVSDSKDASIKSGGKLPAGSVTYRIYVDMLPAYRFQAAYGVPGHELRIETTTSFFNNEESGASTANEVKRNKLGNNTVMLDSWLSVGAAAQNMNGLLKTEDTTDVIKNLDGILQNADTSSGTPLSRRDGECYAAVVPVVTFFGIDSNMISIFDTKNVKTNRQVFSTDNGSWASFGGSIGATPENRVLIAQLTTDGNLSFTLNIQIGTPTGGVENYVAENPVGNEIQLSPLSYSSHPLRITK
jgi:hypothetical protein